MRISSIKVTPVTLPFLAPIRWSGGANATWTRLIIRAETDDGLVGIGETLGGVVTKALIDSEVAAMFLGESPFHLERIHSKGTFLPLYYGKAGHCALAGLELACWDLIGKATGRSLSDLLGGRCRDRVEFSAYLYHRNANDRGEGRIETADDIVAHARALVDRHGFRTLKYKGGVMEPEAEVEVMRDLRRAFPDLKLRYDPNAVLSPATAIRVGKLLEPLDLEYFEDPCWGIEGMARVRERIGIPLATNMCVIDLDSTAEGLRRHAVDVVLGDLFEWGGISRMKRLQGACEVFQLNLNFHSAAEFGIGTTAYLHLASTVPALPHALDTHCLELPYDILRPGTIELDPDGGIAVPDGPGLGVELDEDAVGQAAEAFERGMERSIYAEDQTRRGVIPVKSMY